MSFRIEHRIGVQAPASEIWAMVSDLSRWGEWNPAYPEISGRVAIGEPVRFTFAPPGGKPRSATGVIVDWVPNAQLVWALKLMGGLIRTTRYIEIEVLTETGCILANGERFDGLGASLLPKGMRRQVHQAFAGMNEAAKARAEAIWQAGGAAA